MWECTQWDEVASYFPKRFEVWSLAENGKAIDVWQNCLDMAEICYGYGNSDAHNVTHLGYIWTWACAENLYVSDVLQGLRDCYAVTNNGSLLPSGRKTRTVSGKQWVLIITTKILGQQRY